MTPDVRGSLGAGSAGPRYRPADPAEALHLAAEREHAILSILELTRELTALHDPHAIADLLLLTLMGQFATPRAALWLRPPVDGGAPVLLRSYGIPRPHARELGAICGEPTIIGTLVQRAELRADEMSGLLADADRRLLGDAGLELFAPILVQGAFRGFVGLGRRVGSAGYGPVDLSILQSSLGIVGVTLENTTLFNSMLEKNRQLRQLAEELHQSNEVKAEFLRNVNHELRTPMTIIFGYLEVLLDDRFDSARRREIIEIMMEQSVSLTSLLERLLDFSQSMTRELEMHPADADLARLLRRIHEERLPGMVGGLREFTLEVEETTLTGRYDPERVTQVLNAIVDNAVKFTPPGSHLSIRASRWSEAGRDWNRIEIRDDGPGIPPERIPFLLQAFRQGDGSMTRAVGGLGIGLPLARNLIEGMGGSLRFESELGVGSIITLLIPTA